MNGHDTKKAEKKKGTSPEEKRRDGQAATSENVFDNLMDDAWFPALYADQFMNNDFGPGFPSV